MGTSGIMIKVHAPGTRKLSQFAHPVSRVKSHTSSSNMPKPPQGHLGPPLSFIGFTVLLGCSLSSFPERAFMDNWFLAIIPS